MLHVYQALAENCTAKPSSCCTYGRIALQRSQKCVCLVTFYFISSIADEEENASIAEEYLAQSLIVPHVSYV